MLVNAITHSLDNALFRTAYLFLAMLNYSISGITYAYYFNCEVSTVFLTLIKHLNKEPELKIVALDYLCLKLWL
jgi:hypothetical protein